jgi:RNA polymerase sigma-70 factor (ECF subfamily)
MNDDTGLDALAARARAGDVPAFEALVHRLVRPALAAAWEFVPTREDAEDIVQESFARTWREFGRYDAARPFAPWFFTIVRNVARNATRSDRRWTMVSLTDEVVAAEQLHAGGDVSSLDGMEIGGRVHDALEDLSPMQRACFRLTAIEGFGSSEAGDMLGVSAATVRVHAHRARNALRARFVAERGDES